MAFTLKAENLILKHGFADGMIFEELLADNGFDIDPDADAFRESLVRQGVVFAAEGGEPELIGLAFHEAVLYRIVDDRLMSKLVGYQLVASPMNSNPVRITEGYNSGPLVQDSLIGLSVDVSDEEVLEAAATIKAHYEAVRAPALPSL
jgi:hypothetical protein